MVSLMANHYDHAVEQSSRVLELQGLLNDAHTARTRRPDVIARLNSELTNARTLAMVHADLAIVKALEDLAPRG